MWILKTTKYGRRRSKDKIILNSLFRQLNRREMPVSPNLIYRVNAISTKVPRGFLVEIEKPNLKFIIKMHKT